MTEFYRCSSHIHQRPQDLTPDSWVNVGKDRCCSYCGSWHPDEFIAFLAEAADSSKAGYVTNSDKNYKDYVRRPDVTNASEGAIKFYKWHLPDSISEELQKLYREAIEVSFRKVMAKVDLACLAMEEDTRS